LLLQLLWLIKASAERFFLLSAVIGSIWVENAANPSLRDHLAAAFTAPEYKSAVARVLSIL
jgi:hypothetical protein